MNPILRALFEKHLAKLESIPEPTQEDLHKIEQFRRYLGPDGMRLLVQVRAWPRRNPYLGKIL